MSLREASACARSAAEGRPGPLPSVRHCRLVAGPYRMHAVVGGAAEAGPPVVLVHGLGVSHRYMLPTLRPLSTAHEVHAVDLPGFGLSLDAPTELGLDGLAGALVAWLDAAGLERPLLLGNSLGCHHVVTAAARGREVAGLVLVGPTVDPGARSWAGQVMRFLRDLPREPLFRLLGVVVPPYLRAGPGRLLRLFDEALEDHLEERLPAVEAPVLVVRGGRDPVTSSAWCRHLACLATDGASAEVPSAAHAVNFSHGRELSELTRRFLQRIRAGRRP